MNRLSHAIRGRRAVLVSAVLIAGAVGALLTTRSDDPAPRAAQRLPLPSGERTIGEGRAGVSASGGTRGTASLDSRVLARNATGVTLQANAKGEALITFRADGKIRRVLAWGAINAIDPAPTRRQVAFKFDYAGGWGKYGRPVWKTFKNVCGPYRGPALQWLVAACSAPDGSHWALQSWQRLLPNYGLRPTPKQAAWELRLAHWSGEIAQLEVDVNWAYRRFHHIFGRFTYRGRPVHGFRATPTGQPLDTFGRNLYVDTYNSGYGPGWKRENSFLMHKGSGAFCYGFFPHGSRPAGGGERYRATIIGPGVTPDVYWESPAPGAYDPEADRVANDAIRLLGSQQCKPN